MTNRTYSGYVLAPRFARLDVFIEAVGEHLGLNPKVEVESSFFKSLTDWFPAAIGALMILCAAGCIPFLFWNLWKLTQLDKRK